MNELSLSFGSLASLFDEYSCLIAALRFHSQLFELRLKRRNCFRLLTHCVLTANELLEFILSSIEELKLLICITELLFCDQELVLRGLKSILKCLVVSKRLLQICDLLVFELENFQDLCIFALLLRSLALHGLVKKLI